MYNQGCSPNTKTINVNVIQEGFFVIKINNNTNVNAIRKILNRGNLEECVADNVKVRTIQKYVFNSE